MFWINNIAEDDRPAKLLMQRSKICANGQISLWASRFFGARLRLLNAACRPQAGRSGVPRAGHPRGRTNGNAGAGGGSGKPAASAVPRLASESPTPSAMYCSRC